MSSQFYNFLLACEYDDSCVQNYVLHKRVLFLFFVNELCRVKVEVNVTMFALCTVSHSEWLDKTITCMVLVKVHIYIVVLN